MTTRSLSAQIEEVERELALRRRVYPRMVIQKRMRQGEAGEHILRMEAVLATLKHLQDCATPAPEPASGTGCIYEARAMDGTKLGSAMDLSRVWCRTHGFNCPAFGDGGEAEDGEFSSGGLKW